MPVRISAIVPTYNRGHMIGRVIESLKDQSLPGDQYEVIVVDNGLRDSTREVVQALNRKGGKEIRYVEEPALGLHNARHAGARASRAGILAYTDDDAICDTNWLSAILKEYGDREVACVGGKILPKWEAQEPAWSRFFDPWVLCLVDYGDKRKELAWPQNPFGCNFSFRKDLLFELGGFNPECVGDVWVGDGEAGLLRRTYAKGYKVIYAPDAIVWHVIPPERVSQEGLRKRLRNFGAAHSCAEYKIHRYSAARLILRAGKLSLRYLKHQGLGLYDRIARSEDFYRRDGLKAYLRSRVLYELRLVFDPELKKLVSREDWINEK